MLVERDIGNFYKIKWLDEFMIGHKGMIAGGCFKNIFQNEKVKDIDIFFESNNDYKKAVKYFDDLCGEDNEGLTYKFYYENKKVKAYKHIRTGVTVELISHTYGNPKDILDKFDFTITKFAYFKKEIADEDSPLIDDDLLGEKTHIEYFALCDDKYFEHLHMNRLVVDNQILFPASTFDRMFKYAKYGYFPCKETKMKVIEALRNAKEIDGLSESLYEGLD